MTYFCDFCGLELPDGYVPETDGRGRPVQAVCDDCHATQVRERAQRLGLTAQLLDEYDAIYRTQILPRLGN